MEKQCNKCGNIKDLSAFVKKGGGKYKNICKACNNVRILINLKANPDRLERKREYDRIRARQRPPEKNKEVCAKYQAKIRPIKQKESLERKLLKGLSCKAHWYHCKRCNELVYSKTDLSSTCRKCARGLRRDIGNTKESVCRVCGVIHTPKRRNSMCVSCKVKNEAKQRRLYNSKRKAMVRGASYGLSFDPLDVFKRDKYKCLICGIKVQKKDIYAPNAAELDHIMPLSQGGAHAYYNCQTLCRRCNQAKSNKLIGQLMIPI